MIRTACLSSVISALVTLGLFVGLNSAWAQPAAVPVASIASTAIAYQGRLETDGLPAGGDYDFRFTLQATPEGDNAVGSPITQTRTVTNGTFATTLDFGVGAFNGNARYLSVEAKGAGEQDFVQLSPRQELTPAPYAVFASNGPFWNLGGNGGTTSENFIGTTDTKPLEFRVGGATGLRILPAIVPNMIAGDATNAALAGVFGAVVGGGGASTANDANIVEESYGTISGGTGNHAGFYSSVGGGYRNFASGQYSVVSGGDNNHASDSFATIGGGDANAASGRNSTVSGGEVNVAAAEKSTVAGGASNDATGTGSTVSGGVNSTASGASSTVAGGNSNTVSAQFSTVGGGFGNTASGYASVVPGGYLNLAKGDYSFAAGYRAKANSTGSFVWADNTPQDFNVSLTNGFLARAAGGFYLVLTTTPQGGFSKYCRLTANVGSWECFSDREYKTIIREADGRDVLAKLEAIPIDYWMATDVEEPTQHLGPMAQDFYAAFGLGDNERTISSIDLDGVALAAIKGLGSIAREQAQEIEELTARLDAIEGSAAGAPGTVSSNAAQDDGDGRSGWLWFNVAGVVSFLVLAVAVFVRMRRDRRVA